MRNPFKRLWNDKRGNILIITAAAMPVLIGSAGLATDTIQWVLWKRQLQRAADSAAIAGVYQRNATALGATDGVSAAVLRDLELNQHVGDLLGTIPTSCLEAETGATLLCPADATSPDARNNQVEVTLTYARKLSFSSMFLTNPPVITAKARAASVPGAGEYCMIALDPRNVIGADIGGNTSLDLGECCIIANASHPNQAFQNTGNASNVKAGCIAAVGGVQFSSSGNWDVDNYFPYSDPAADPYAHLTIPPACDVTWNPANQVKDDTNFVTDTAAGHAGKVVCVSGGFTINAKLTLAAATYVIDTANDKDDLSMNSTGSELNCDGCTIIMTNSANPANTANVKLTGGTVNIKAPTSGTYSGIAFYQDRLAVDDDKKGANHINGNDNAGVQGVIYTPSRSILYNGGASITQIERCLQIVGRRLEFTGNSKIKLSSACGSAGMTGQTGGGSLVRLVA